MQRFLSALVVVLAMSSASSVSFGYGLCDLLGCPKKCGCGCEVSCECEADCCCEPACGCEVSCGCEPGCGCGTECCVDGRHFAGEKYCCGCDSHVPWCPCTGPDCCNSGGCGDCCEPCDCGGEVSCGCEPGCGCGSGCCEPCCPPQHKCCLKHVGFCRPLYCLVKWCDSCCNSGCGCSGEVYWSEWHNDPPRCSDPCDCYGNWTGPGNGPYRAPYAHAYSPETFAGGGQVNGVSQASYAKQSAPRKHTVARQPQPAQTKKTANRGAAAIIIRR